MEENAEIRFHLRRKSLEDESHHLQEAKTCAYPCALRRDWERQAAREDWQLPCGAGGKKDEEGGKVAHTKLQVDKVVQREIGVATTLLVAVSRVLKKGCCKDDERQVE